MCSATPRQAPGTARQSPGRARSPRFALRVCSGLKMNVDFEPFEWLAALMLPFRKSDADADASQKRAGRYIDNEMKRDAVYRKHGKEIEQAPMEAMRVARRSNPACLRTIATSDRLARACPALRSWSTSFVRSTCCKACALVSA